MDLINLCAILYMPVLEQMFIGLSPKTRGKIIFLVLLILLSMPISLAIIAINISFFQLKNNELEIELRGSEQVDKLSNNAEYSTSKTEKRLIELEQKVERLKQERPRDPLVKEVVGEFQEFKPTVREQINQTGELTDLLGTAIAK